MKKPEWDRNRVFREGIVLGACAALLIYLVTFRLYQQPKLDVARAPLPLNSNSPAHLLRGTLPWYVHSGQWRADVQTLAAVLRYLTDADKVAQTNGACLKG